MGIIDISNQKKKNAEKNMNLHLASDFQDPQFLCVSQLLILAQQF